MDMKNQLANLMKQAQAMQQNLEDTENHEVAKAE